MDNNTINQEVKIGGCSIIKTPVTELISAGFILTPLRESKLPYKGWNEAMHNQYAPEQLGLRYAIVLTGEYLVLDYDPRRNIGNENQLQVLFEQLNIATPIETYVVATGGSLVNGQSGFHVYFKKPADFKVRGSTIPGMPSIEIKSKGRYVVAEGSLHDSGRLYTRFRGTPLNILNAPDSLLEICKAPDILPTVDTQVIDDSEHARSRFVDYIVNKQGHLNTAYVIANTGKDFGLPQETIVKLMLEHCNAFWVDDPISESVARARAEHAFKYGQNIQGCKSLQNEYADEIRAIQNQSEAANEAIVNPWPVLGDQALYGIAGDIVRIATIESEADPAAVLLTFLTWAGAAFGRDCHLIIGETTHAPRLMAAIVGASSRARKGTSTSPVERIFRKAEEYLLYVEENFASLKVTSGPLSSGEGLVYAVRDGTPEDEGVRDKRLLVIESEFAAPLKAMQREGNTLSAILRSAWDYGNIAPLTKSNRITATNAHICVIAHVTRNELGKLLQSSDLWNGFANRFIWVCARRQKLVPVPKSMPAEETAKLANQLARAIIHARQMNRIELSPDAVSLWTKTYPKLTADASGTFGAVTARAEAQVMRIAFVFALLDSSHNIQPAHLTAALSVWDYCRDSARFIFEQTEGNPMAAKILSALKDGEKTQTQVNKLFSGHASSTQLKSILADLQAVGRITQRLEGGSKGKGKQTIYWSLRPGFNYVDADFADLEE